MDDALVPYHRDLDPEIARLQVHLWGADVGCNAAYLRWKYSENPYLDDTLIQLVRQDGQLVGMRGLFGTLWEVDGSGAPHVLPYADDFVIAPEHRNRGVAARLMQANAEAAARRGFRFAVNLSAGPITFVGSLASGWRSAGSFGPVTYRRPASRAEQRLHALVGPRLSGRVAPLLRVLRREGGFDRLDRAGAAPSGIAVERQTRPEAMAALVRRLPWDGRIRHVRDARYFAWRFRNPLHEYRFLFAGQGDLQGYLVLQRYRSSWADQTLINVVDWEAVDDATRATLLDAALALGQPRQLQTWTSGVAPATAALLRQRGFAAAAPASVRTRSAGLLVRRLDAAADATWQLGSRNLLTLADWDLRLLYSMAG
ncbi:MAG: GNAT family N-acetyltransferase [Candidatus Binatia bacterium]